MLKEGMKIKLVEPMGMLRNVGEEYSIAKLDEETITVSCGAGLMCVMNSNALEKFFEIVKEPEEEKAAPTVDPDYIDYLINNSNVTVATVFDKCTVVTVQLPNGFVITQSSACVSPENYDVELGTDICMNKITEKLWELEGYRLQCELYENEDLEELGCDSSDCCGCCFDDRVCENCEGNCEAE